MKNQRICRGGALSPPNMKNQNLAGFAIVSAIFLVVVLSLIAAFIVSVVATSRSTSNYVLQGARADYAAWSGIEWAIAKAFPPYNSCLAGPTVLSYSQGGLNNFTASVTCSVQTYSEGGVNNVKMYQITSTGQYSTPGNQDYVSRQWQTTVSH